jgi:hypothetical protein
VELFKTWEELLVYLDEHCGIVHYRATLDRYAVPVVVTRYFKNGKLRCDYHGVKFTADRGHLNRFLKKCEDNYAPAK